MFEVGLFIRGEGFVSGLTRLIYISSGGTAIAESSSLRTIEFG